MMKTKSKPEVVKVVVEILPKEAYEKVNGEWIPVEPKPLEFVVRPDMVGERQWKALLRKAKKAKK
jgi:hypothetical protein